MSSGCRLLLLAATIWSSVGLASACSSSSPTASKLELQFVNTSDGAVCNDGSPAGYFWVEGEGDGASTWLVFLAGGGWCYDEASCLQRSRAMPLFTSSRAWSHSCSLGGIFDTRPENALAKANKVFLAYCSSDAFMGDQDASAGRTFGFHFKGQSIVRAVFSDLIDRHGLGSKGDKELVVFGGGSAGARGALVHDHLFRNMLPPTVSHVLLLDSPLWLDLPPLRPGVFDGFGNQTRKVYDLVNGSRLVSPECSAVYGAKDQWRCLFAQYRLPFVQSSYFMVASQYDAFQLSFDLSTNGAPAVPPYSTNQLAYANHFASTTRSYVKGVTHKRLRSEIKTPSKAVFSSACFDHFVSADSRFFTERVGTVSMAAALRAFLSEPQSYRFVEECEGFACGPACR